MIKYVGIIIILSLSFGACNNNLEPKDNKKNDQIIEDKDSTLIIEDEELVEALFDTLTFNNYDTINLELYTEFSLGKLWSITQSDDSLKIINDKILRLDKGDGLKNYQVLNLGVLDTGYYQIILENKRPFGENVGIRKVLNQTIIIK